MSRTRQNQDAENQRLRKDLVQAKAQIQDLQEELEEKTSLYLNAVKDRKQHQDKLTQAREQISKVEAIVKQKVQDALAGDRQLLDQLKKENQNLKASASHLETEGEQLRAERDKYREANKELNNYLGENVRTITDRTLLTRLDTLRADKAVSDKKVLDLLSEINTVTVTVSDLTMENKQLRRMANLPDNYGIDLNTIKLHDKEKIEDFKRLIKVLQDDNYKLEEERARLKHAVKTQAIVNHSQYQGQPYGDLTPEQIERLDEFVRQLRQNDPVLTGSECYTLKKENEKLQAQLEILNSKGYDIIKHQLDSFFREKGGMIGGGGNVDSADQKKLMAQLQQIQTSINQHMSSAPSHGLSMTQSVPRGTGADAFANTNRFNFQGQKAPIPQYDQRDGKIHEVILPKFGNSIVKTSDGKDGTGVESYERAFLQGQVQEVLELVKRKDEDMKSKQQEIAQQNGRIRQFLLTQEELYKDLVRCEQSYDKKEKSLKQAMRSTEQQLLEEQDKTNKLESALKAVSGGGSESLQGKIIDLTKQNSILDVNLLRLTRKYQALEEQEKLLRRDYHNKDADMAEKDYFVQQRLNDLKEWKANAVMQMSQLFKKLRDAVPQSEYRDLQKKHEIQLQQYNEVFNSKIKLTAELSKQQSHQRVSEEAEATKMLLMEQKEQIQAELDVLRRRLEYWDDSFKWENKVFNKIAQVLNRAKVSPQAAFEQFDADGNGSLERGEFISALNALHVFDLTSTEMDILWNSLDNDQSGGICYHEFIRKLERFGVANRSSDETVIYQMMEAAKRANMNMASLFEMIDSRGNGIISRENFEDVFFKLNLTVDQRTLESFIDNFWKENKAGIDYKQFLNIFKRYEVRMEDEEKAARSGTHTTPENIIRLKKAVFDQINQNLVQQNIPIRQLFQTIDKDGQGDISATELYAMFQGMGISNVSGPQSRDIFDSIDFDRGGSVSLPEFQSDFKHYVEHTVEMLINEERNRKQAMDMQEEQTKGYRKESSNEEIKAIQLQTKVEMSKVREKQLQDKVAQFQRILNVSDNTRREIQDQNNKIEQENLNLKHINLEQKGKIEIQAKELSLCIRKDEHAANQQRQEELITELTETRAAMLSYKNMHNVIAEQVKSLKFAQERKKDEQDNLFEALREMQSDGVTQERLGKLYFVIMLSRWQEAAVNKKYTEVLSECKELRSQVISYKSMLQQKEEEHTRNEEHIVELTRKSNYSQHELDKTKGAYINQNRVMEFQKIIQDLSDSKTELEEEFMNAKRQQKLAQRKVHENAAKAQQYEELHNQLKKGTQSDISNKLIELSHQLYQVRLEQYRATSENEEMRENEKHLKRLLERKEDALKSIENKAAADEKALIQEQELFRNRDNERTRKYCNRFEEAPQLGRNVSAGPVTVFDKMNKAAGMTQSFDRAAPNMPKGFSTSNFGGPNNAGMSTAIGAPNTKSEMDAEFNRIREENELLHQEIHGMTAKIKRMEAWNTNDQYLSYEDEAVKDAIDKNRDQMFAQNDQDRSEMAGAAQKAVQTLQQMLDQKNHILNQKEEFIKKLKTQHEEARKNDQEEMSTLRRQLTQNGTTALGRMRDIIDKHDAHSKVSAAQPKKNQSNSKYADMGIDQIQLEMNRKEDEIKSLKRQQVQYNDSRDKFRTKIQQLEELTQRQKEELVIANKKVDLQRFQKLTQKLQEEARVKDANQRRLQQLIDNLNQKMMKYESEKLDINDKVKKNEINALTAQSGHSKVIANWEMKHKMAENLTKKANEELSNFKVKNNELESQKLANEAKVEKAQADAFKLQNDVDALRRNIGNRDTEIEDLKARLQKSNAGGGGETMSPAELQRQNTELSRLVDSLKQTQIQVVAPNSDLGTFEWIGEPIPLDSKKQMTNMDEILTALKAHLATNHRITFASIFHSLDRTNAKSMSYESFNQGMQRMGIQLSPQSEQIIGKHLDPNNNRKMNYEALVLELQGVPQKMFVNPAVKILSSLAESRNPALISQKSLQQFIDPKFENKISERSLIATMNAVRSSDFQNFGEDQCRALMKYMCGMNEGGRLSTGQTFMTNDLIEKIWIGVEAICVERMHDALATSGQSLPDLMTKHGKLRPGCMRRPEVQDMFQELKIFFNDDIYETIVFGRLLGGGDLITHDQLKFVFGIGKHSSKPVFKPVAKEEQKVGNIVRKSGKTEGKLSQNKAGVPIDHADHLQEEENRAAKSAARKVLNAFAQSLQVELHKMDKDSEGMVETSMLKAKICDYQIKDLAASEVDLLMNICDSRGYGVVVIANFIEKMQNLAQESENETKLRWFANTVGHQGINLRMELNRFDTKKAGQITLMQFKKAIKGMALAQQDQEIDKLFKAGYAACSTDGTLMDIKSFVDLVTSKSKEKPPQSFMKIGQQPGSKTSGGSAGSKTSTFETWELEKKYKKNLDALKDTIAEKNQDIITAQNKESDANKRVIRLENEKRKLEDNLVGVRAKTCSETAKQSRTLGQLDEVQKLNDQVFHLQEVNKSLQKTIRVDLKMDLGDMQMKKESLENENKILKSKLQDIKQELVLLASQKATSAYSGDKSLEQRQIRELNAEINALKDDRDDLEKQLSEEAQLTLELKFEKEGVDLKFARLQKRIQDLEQFKMESSSLSAELKNQREEELKRIEEDGGKLSKEHLTKTPGESVKVRPMKHKTAQELELVVESLRRVIEKQMVEMDQLKTQKGKLEALNAKKDNVPAMELKILDLESQLETFLKQETNQEDFQRTIKKMVQANKFLREDLDTETQRYRLLEDKYAKLLVEWKLAQKEMQKTQGLMFQTQAGANMENNLNFLEAGEDEDLFKFDDKLGAAYGQRKRH